jgi:hypothetical protein
VSAAPQTFGERFLAEFTDFSPESVQQDVAVLRRRAARVLLGIPWQFIPTERCERRAIVGLRTLMMLCCCLDCLYGADSGAKPGAVTTEEIFWAWKAAGRENWLKRVTLRQLREQADRQVLAQHRDLMVGAIFSRFEQVKVPEEDER